MNNILYAPFLRDMCELTDNLYRLGWDERNGGNVSLIVPEDEIRPYLDTAHVVRTIPAAFDASALAGRCFLVTGTGKYMKNVSHNPAGNLGIVRVQKDGHGLDVLWGFDDGGGPTSELAAHFMSHIERLKRDPEHRVILHAHCTNLIVMTFIHSLDEREFVRTLWQMSTECLVVFPDGVGVLPWMLCGGSGIGRATADKMKEFRMVLWAHHGILGAGRDLDEAFGLVETAEKAAEIYIKLMGRPILQTITDQQLLVLADAFGVKVKEGYLRA
ncbi:MAG: rhamnulose-1-phosphate aldolase [Acetanaerobacterium sp.]